MEEKLSLGLPDVAASIAPKNRFEIHDKPAPRYWRAITPAIIFAGLGAFLGKLHSETQPERPQQEHEPLADSSGDVKVEVAQAQNGVDIIQQVAEYLQQVAEEAGRPARRVRYLAESTSLTPFTARVTMELGDRPERRSANDNLETFEIFKPLVPMGIRSRADDVDSGSNGPGTGGAIRWRWTRTWAGSGFGSGTRSGRQRPQPSSDRERQGHAWQRPHEPVCADYAR